jgi:hydroxymethylpyrimidine pyrophosphatase-like HAD family hydrolase
MRIRVLALDFDNTIAVNDRLDHDVAAVLQKARGSGVLRVLVTGRILSDLLPLLPSPDLFDAIVAENGAVLQLAHDPHPIALSRGPDAALVAELNRRSIAHRCGICIVEAAAATSHDVLTIVQTLGLPHGISFNRDRLMVLPYGVSKAEGLREAVWRLGASLHNALTIGDAENDQPLLDACEIGVAVGWGSEALKRCADQIIQGSGPPAVAAYIRDLLATGTVPPDRAHRNFLRLGTRENGEPLDGVVRGRNLLVAGDSKSGKSWIAGLLCEQYILKDYSVCILDPEGDYVGLDALPGVIVHRLGQDTDSFPDLERILRQPVLSLVVDLSAIQAGAKPAIVKTLLQRINALRRSLGFPHRVVLDESHYFLGGPDDAELFDRELGGYLLVTFRVADLSANVLSATDAIIVTKVTDRRLAAGLLALVPGFSPPSGWVDTLAGLMIGEALLLPGTPELGNVVTRFQIAPRLTTHVRHLQKYLDVVVRPGQEFVFTRQGRATDWRARTLGEFLAVLPQVSEEVLQGHMARGDFHRWVENVIGDRELGEEIRLMERGDASNARNYILRSVYDRYLGAAT